MPQYADTAASYTLTIFKSGKEQQSILLPPGARMRVGRDPRMEVCLDDNSVSRAHAEIRERNGEVRLRDLRSLNGTHCNGEVVNEAMIRPGDVVRIGIFTLQLSLAIGPGGHRDDDPISKHLMPRKNDEFEIIHALDLDQTDPMSSRLSTNLTSMGLDAEEARRSQRKLSSAYSKLLSLMNAVARIGRLTEREAIIRQFLEALLTSFDNVEAAGVFTLADGKSGKHRLLHAETQTGKGAIHNDAVTQALLERSRESSRAIYAVEGPPPRANDSSTQRTRRSMMCGPIIVRGETRGLLYVENTKRPYCFDHFDLDLLAVFAFHLATALENSQLILDLLERKAAEEEMRLQEELLRHLSAQTLAAQEHERGRISRELHDGVGQSLTALRYQLESLRTLARPMPNNEKIIEELRQVSSFAATIIDDLRRISLDLRPTMLDDLGLQPTIEWFVRQFDERSSVRVSREYELSKGDVPPEVATAAFRIIQEALGNVYKHANAKSVWLKLECKEDKLEITIRDDGSGFDPAQLRTRQAHRVGSGLVNMRERAHQLAGEFHLDAGLGRGTTISILLPLTEK